MYFLEFNKNGDPFKKMPKSASVSGTPGKDNAFNTGESKEPQNYVMKLSVFFF